MMTPAEKELGVTLPPAELPYDDGEPMESQRHKYQMDLLIDALLPWLEKRQDGFVGGNMFVYYSLAQVRRDFKGPDFFAALGVPKGERKSWVCWEEDKTPDVVIELLSNSTSGVDKGEKKLIYQNRMHVPEYFWYDPFNSQDFVGFRLRGSSYQAIAPDLQRRLVSETLELALMQWQGTYRGIETTWLRWEQLDGTLLFTPEEVERQRVLQAEAQIVQIARFELLQTSIASDQIAAMTGLAITQVEALRD